MTVGVTGNRYGYVHEAAFYDSDEEFLAIVVPFLEEGLREGHPALVALSGPREQLVRAAMPQANLSFIDRSTIADRPASVIKTYRQVLAEHVANGAHRIHLVGDVPHPGEGAPWQWWARYEAAVNHIYNDFPVRGLCPYDTRTTPAEVLDDVARTHPYLRTEGRPLPSIRFEDPAAFLSGRTMPAADPLESSSPAVDLIDPSLAAARRAVRRVAGDTELGQDEVDDLTLAVNEAVTNALCHGDAPIRLRLWGAHDRVVTTVTDRGSGPADPLVGLRPPQDLSSGGMGLWMAHQLCSDVALGATGEGFTLRLTAGIPSCEVRGS